MSWESDSLLCQIVRCPELAGANADETHPCSNVVRFQDRIQAPYQPPTPWIGRLAEAPILFIGSNPNIGGGEYYPKQDWDDEDLVDFFDGAFDGNHSQIKFGRHARRADGTYGAWVRTWAQARGRAKELLQRDPVPGTDYAMTEIVRCRSQDEIGVEEARNTCADLYLERTVRLSDARVIVAFGVQVRDWLRGRWGLNAEPVSTVSVGSDRLVAFLPHPASFGPKKFGTLMPDELPRLRAAVTRTL